MMYILRWKFYISEPDIIVNFTYNFCMLQDVMSDVTLLNSRYCDGVSDGKFFMGRRASFLSGINPLFIAEQLLCMWGAATSKLQ